MTLSVGYEYDINVMALPTKLLKTTDVTFVSDSRAVLTFNGGYKILDKGGLSITPSYFLYQSLYKKYSNQDIQYHL